MFAKLGPTFRELRESAGLSQAELARKARVGKAQLSKYESGKELPTLRTLGRLLRALDAEPLTLFYVAHLLQCRAEISPLSLLLVTRTPLPDDPALASFKNLFGHFLDAFEVLMKTRLGSDRPGGRQDQRAKQSGEAEL